MEQQQTASNVAQVLSEPQISEARECGRRFAVNKVERTQIAEAMAKSMGIDPTFDQWEAHRKWFTDGYAQANADATENAADKAWSEFAKCLKDWYGLEKPRATTAAATAKASERANKKAALLAAHEDADAEEIRDRLVAAYETAAKDPSNKNTKAAIKNLETVLRHKTADEDKARKDAVTALRKTIRDRLGKCEDVDTLGQIIDLLADFAE